MKPLIFLLLAPAVACPAWAQREDALVAADYQALDAMYFGGDQRVNALAGKLADLAVLSGDYMTIPVERIGGLESVMTMVGGKVVYAAAPFTALERGIR